MMCPFLVEMAARSCRAAPTRKIPTAAIAAADDRCTSKRYADCPALRDRPERHAGLATCPLLEEQWVQYCGASPVHKLIPCNDALLSSCNDAAHRYCALYLARSHPDGRRGPASQRTAPVTTLDHLLYSRNHMWMDLAEDRSCHIGVDDFVARVLGRVEGVRFLAGPDNRWPAACLELREADLWMEFPHRIQVTRANVHLRGEPQPIVTDPYGAGWLYAGVATARDLDSPRGPKPLLRGANAVQWMRQDLERLNRFAAEESSHRSDGERLAADGGTFVAGIAQQLDREQLLRLYHTFFVAHGAGRC